MFTRTKWPALLVRVAMLVIGLIETPALAATPASPVGNWSTTNGRGVIAIEPCGDSLCGRIVGIERSATDPMPTDVAGHSQCGLTIITNQKPTSDRAWLGEITDPRDGGTYQAKLWVDDGGNLHLRAFIGIPQLGATRIWHRYTGHLTAACRLT